MRCSSNYHSVLTQVSPTLSSCPSRHPQMGVGWIDLALRILVELKSHRLGRVARFSPLPVPLAVGGSSDKTSSLFHATHSPFGQTHSGLSDRQRKHGQALRRCGPGSETELCTGLCRPSHSAKAGTECRFRRAASTKRAAWSGDKGMNFEVRQTQVRILNPLWSRGVTVGDFLLSELGVS